MFERELRRTVNRLSVLITAFIMGIVMLVEAIYLFNYRGRLYSEFLYRMQGEIIALLNQMELEEQLRNLTSTFMFAIYTPDTIIVRNAPVPDIKEEGIHHLGDTVFITVKFFKFEQYKPYLFITVGDSFREFLGGRLRKVYRIFFFLDILLLLIVYSIARDISTFLTRTLIDRHRYLSQLVRKFHHDLRIPLSVIMLNLDDDSIKPEVRESIKDALRYMDEITLSFKSLYDERRTMEDVNVKDEVEHILRVFSANLRAKDIEVKTDLSDVRVKANKYMLRRLLLNLLDNAIRYSPRGSTIEITLRSGTLTIRNRGNYMGDEGTGIKTVKFIADFHGWNFYIDQRGDTVVAVVRFGKLL